MRRALIALVLLVASSVTALAQQRTEGYYPPDVESIRRAGRLVVAMTSFDSPPFYSGTAGEIRGLDVDIANQVAAVLRVPVHFRRDASTFAEVVEQVRNRQADVAISKLSITGPRMTMVRFSTPYVQLRQALIVNRLWMSQNANGRASAEIIRTFNGSIAFMRGSSYDTFARANFPRASYMPETSWDRVVENVMNGTYAAGFRDDFEIKRIAFERPSASITTRSIIIQDSVDNIAAAVHAENHQLLSIVNFVIQNQFSNVTVDTLIARLRAEQQR